MEGFTRRPSEIRACPRWETQREGTAGEDLCDLAPRGPGFRDPEGMTVALSGEVGCPGGAGVERA